MKSKLLSTVLCLTVGMLIIITKTVFATAPSNPWPYTLPYTYNGVTYTKAFQIPDPSSPHEAKSIYYNGTATFISALFTTWNSPTIVIVNSKNDDYGDGDVLINELTLPYPYKYSYMITNDVCFDSEYVKSSENIYQEYDWEFQRSNFHCNFEFVDTNTLVVPASDYFTPPLLLTITINHEDSGVVESTSGSPGSIDCPTTTCEDEFYGDVTLSATPEDDWVFECWDDGASCYEDNPITVSLSGDTSLTAILFKTFRDSAGSFYADIGDVEGQCIVYVRTETEIPWDDMNGDAKDSYQQAIDAGYQTSATVPRISSVIVFDYQEGSIPSEGHVGIVTAINGTNITFRDSNWNGDGKVGVRTKDVSNYNILGYIYHTP